MNAPIVFHLGAGEAPFDDVIEAIGQFSNRKMICCPVVRVDVYDGAVIVALACTAVLASSRGHQPRVDSIGGVTMWDCRGPLHPTDVGGCVVSAEQLVGIRRAGGLNGAR